MSPDFLGTLFEVDNNCAVKQIYQSAAASKRGTGPASLISIS